VAPEACSRRTGLQIITSLQRRGRCEDIIRSVDGRGRRRLMMNELFRIWCELCVPRSHTRPVDDEMRGRTEDGVMYHHVLGLGWPASHHKALNNNTGMIWRL
jgi:hypothetical protein